MMLLLDAFAIALAGFGAFLLKFDFDLHAIEQRSLFYAVGIWLAIKIAVFAGMGITRAWWRYISIHDIARLLWANTIGSVISTPVILTILGDSNPRALYVLDFVLCLLLTSANRITAKALVSSWLATGYKAKAVRTLIYGAGDAGTLLLRELRQNPSLEYEVVGFIDDDPKKQSLRIHGCRVLGAGDFLPSIVRQRSVENILIAIPSATGGELRSILARCRDAGVPCKTMPSLGELIRGASLARQIRDVDVADLLGRPPVQLRQDVISDKLRGRTILVTGAGGSIGSELCRQIAAHCPSSLIGLELSETALFHIDRELRSGFPLVRFQAEVGDVQNAARVSEVLGHYRPDIVFHAAGYKHVPLMESHPFEAIEKNVFGTLNLVLAATACGISDFVMVSSDKAAGPISIMGASKRLAEMMLASTAAGPTKFMSVRLGNVLDSNGSVVQLFKQQIANGGPVTVTHPQMYRYFMTISEACQLILHASAIGKGGELFVLEMGDPLRIFDLAETLIQLSGLRPHDDIDIVFSGVRPGEKLREQLIAESETTAPTGHEKIQVIASTTLSESAMLSHLAELRDCCNRRDAGALVDKLREVVGEYEPGEEILSWSHAHSNAEPA